MAGAYDHVAPAAGLGAGGATFMAAAGVAGAPGAGAGVAAGAAYPLGGRSPGGGAGASAGIGAVTKAQARKESSRRHFEVRACVSAKHKGLHCPGRNARPGPPRHLTTACPHALACPPTHGCSRLLGLLTSSHQPHLRMTQPPQNRFMDIFNQHGAHHAVSAPQLRSRARVVPSYPYPHTRPYAHLYLVTAPSSLPPLHPPSQPVPPQAAFRSSLGAAMESLPEHCVRDVDARQRLGVLGWALLATQFAAGYTALTAYTLVAKKDD